MDLSENGLRKFARTMAFCLAALGLILFLRHKQGYGLIWIIALFFLLCGQCAPLILKPAYKLWMGLAFCLGWLNTRIILTLLYYVVVTPIGLCAKVFGKDFLDARLDTTAQSYWHKRKAVDFSKEQYERIF